MGKRRRRVPRVAVDWPATCRLSDGRVHDAVVRDVSMIGAGLEIIGFTEPDLVGRLLNVNVEPITGTAVALCFTGEVKHRAAGKPGSVRVGIAFVLSEVERSVLDALTAAEATW